MLKLLLPLKQPDTEKNIEDTCKIKFTTFFLMVQQQNMNIEESVPVKQTGKMLMFEERRGGKISEFFGLLLW